MGLGNTKESCAKVKRRHVSLWHLHVKYWKLGFFPSGPVVVSHIPTTNHQVAVRKTVLQGFPSQRICQLLSMLHPVLCLSGSKICVEVCNSSVSHCVSMPRWAMEKPRVVAQMDWEQLDFPYETFQHNTENRGAGQEKKQKRLRWTCPKPLVIGIF